MIRNFEKITEELTTEELALIPILISGFKLRSKTNPVKAPEVVRGMSLYIVQHNLKIKFTEPRLRKCVNFIRANGLIPLIATSNGYYVSTNKEEILGQIESLKQRANSMLNGASGLLKYINEN
jgi:hypothetical protein